MNAPPLQPVGCRRCGLAQLLPARVALNKKLPRSACVRCGAVFGTQANTRTTLTTACAVGALLLYPPAIALPVITIERFGHERASTILSGAIELMAEGQVAVGLLVFVCSIITPALKLLATLMLTTGRLSPRVRGSTWRLIELIGRWGMLDVLLVAVLVATVKLGDWADVVPGPGLLAFAGVVALSLLASAAFNPATLWQPARPA